MDWVSRLFDSLSALPNDPVLVPLFFSLLLGAAVLGSVRALYLLIAGAFNPLRKRVLLIQQKTRLLSPKSRITRALERLGRYSLPKDEAKRRRTEVKLRFADFRSEHAVPAFYGIKITVVVLAPVLVLMVAMFSPVLLMDNAPRDMLMAGILALVAPDYLLGRRVKRRQARLQRGLADAMDLLVVCSEAGLGLVASIQRVAAEILLTHPDLSGELTLFSMQSRAGMDSRAALNDLKERTGVEDIQTLVAMLLQSMRFGTSIAETLRVYSAELRDKRLQEVEAKAARVGTLMLFPMITCILPSFLLIILGPPLIGVFRALG
ncbi:type II secretion system F family protein [uncultured Thiodictyon sp.]|uniref:type II secretion system F family protein n=1 Tax=uncultured Thiodictyon sp. TaxID=1846217 RepID=UPI0025CD5BB2|nr:type II secretion system F family protein [uncultured Thiodictyon sp.]